MYSINITAQSHTGVEASQSLPVDDISSSDPSSIGLIVDNYIPSVDRVIVYTTYPDGQFHPIYLADWKLDITSNFAREKDSSERRAGYLPISLGDEKHFGYLGIAVRFTENMDSSNLPYAWIEGSWNDEVQWASYYEGPNQMVLAEPDPIIPEGLFEETVPPLEEDIIGHWLFYRSRSYVDPGYVGDLLIKIGASPVQTIPNAGLGLDLAGNSVDTDPSSIETPIEWATIPSPSLEPDGSYLMLNSMSYEHIADCLFQGTAIMDNSIICSVVPVYIEDIHTGYSFGYSVGTIEEVFECPSRKGFWMWEWYGETFMDGIDLVVYEPDNEHYNEKIATMYPIVSGPGVLDPGETGSVIDYNVDFNPIIGYYANPISSCGNFFYFATNNVEIYEESAVQSDAIGYNIAKVTCVSEDFNIVIDEVITEGEIYPAETFSQSSRNQALSPKLELPVITNIDENENGLIEVEYYFYEEGPYYKYFSFPSEPDILACN